MCKWILLLSLWFNPTTAFIAGSTSPHATTHLPTQSQNSNSPHRIHTTNLHATPSNAGASVESLLTKNRPTVDALSALSPTPIPELTRLRFALAFPSQSEATRALRETLTYRTGPGLPLITAAQNAVTLATADGGWDNEPVRNAAPHADRINRFINEKNILTLSTEEGDLLYVIRASLIDDKQLMNEVSVEEMTEFFLYVKEVHNLIANGRSARTGRMCEVIFANDISGVRKPPDRRFSKALTESSQQYEKLYPSLAGPTMILNLPFVLQAFVGLIKPLFPKGVQERLLFARAPVLARQKVLTPLTSGGERDKFLREVKILLKK